MGNAPTGGKRRNSNEDGTANRESQVIGQHTTIFPYPVQKKLIIKPTQDVYDFDPITRILAEADTTHIGENINADVDMPQVDHNKTLPTVFKWEGGGRDVFLSGSFNGWKAKIPMVKSKHNFYTIVDLPKGEHQYKFIVDGAWKIDHKQRIVNNANGAQNNMLSVKTSDFDVLEALQEDIANSKSASGTDQSSRQTTSPSGAVNIGTDKLESNIEGGLSSSPPGSYSQEIPSKLPIQETSEKTTPPLIPPQLLQVILNKETGVHCDPNLLPQPNHVMINHMYALSIKDGVIVLSAIARYRQKFVSTVMYKPI